MLEEDILVETNLSFLREDLRLGNALAFVLPLDV